MIDQRLMGGSGFQSRVDPPEPGAGIGDRGEKDGRPCKRVPGRGTCRRISPLYRVENMLGVVGATWARVCFSIQ